MINDQIKNWTVTSLVCCCWLVQGCSTPAIESQNGRLPATHKEVSTSHPDIMDASESELEQMLKGDRVEFEKIKKLKESYGEAEQAQKETSAKLKELIKASKEKKSEAGLDQHTVVAAAEAEHHFALVKKEYEAELARLNDEVARAKSKKDIERLVSFGKLYDLLQDYKNAEDCFQIPAHQGNAFAQTYILATAERLKPMLDENRVNPAFAAFGNMYQVGNVIFSGVARQKATRGFLGINAREGGEVARMKWDNAKRFCQNLGGGSRLPTREEFMALGRAMSQGGRYNPDRIADMRGNWFWSASEPDSPDRIWSESEHESPDLAYGFHGHDGKIDIGNRAYEKAVRCVIGL